MPVGRLPLSITRLTLTDNCTQPDHCLQCGGAAYMPVRITAPFIYSRFLGPTSPSMQLMAMLKSEITEGVLSWTLAAITNQQAISSTEVLSGWTAFISGASGDTGLVEQSFLSSYYSFSSHLTPEGMRKAANPVCINPQPLRNFACCRFLVAFPAVRFVSSHFRPPCTRLDCPKLQRGVNLEDSSFSCTVPEPCIGT